MSYQPFTARELAEQRTRRNMTTADKLAQYRYMLKRAERAGVNRPDIRKMIAKLEGV